MSDRNGRDVAAGGSQLFTPREIVSELDRYVIGQSEAKRAVAVALRNRWRRQQVSEELRDEIAPKNIIMIGATGVGKTEIARRLAKLAQAPFIKVEASKFTEVGYVGRDVESIIRDLTELAIQLVSEEEQRAVSARRQRSTRKKSCSMRCSRLPFRSPDSSIGFGNPYCSMMNASRPGAGGAGVGASGASDAPGVATERDARKAEETAPPRRARRA